MENEVQMPNEKAFIQKLLFDSSKMRKKDWEAIQNGEKTLSLLKFFCAIYFFPMLGVEIAKCPFGFRIATPNVKKKMKRLNEMSKSIGIAFVKNERRRYALDFNAIEKRFENKYEMRGIQHSNTPMENLIFRYWYLEFNFIKLGQKLEKMNEELYTKTSKGQGNDALLWYLLFSQDQKCRAKDKIIDRIMKLPSVTKIVKEKKITIIPYSLREDNALLLPLSNILPEKSVLCEEIEKEFCQIVTSPKKLGGFKKEYFQKQREDFVDWAITILSKKYCYYDSSWKEKANRLLLKIDTINDEELKKDLHELLSVFQ